MFDVETLRQTITAHGPVARVVIASVEGSSPREVGASMLVWQGGQSGTIGGGALEWQAVTLARSVLAAPPTPLPSPRGGGEALLLATQICADRSTPVTGIAASGSPPPGGEGMGAGGTPHRALVTRIPLGPALGQCCGGAVTLLTETFGRVQGAASPSPLGGEGRGEGAEPFKAGPTEEPRDIFANPPGDLYARPVDGRPMPLSVMRLLDRARAQGALPAPTLLQGWFIEPIARPLRHLWVWGAGHVGRALVQVMAPLPDLSITWIDVAPDRYPADIPGNVTALPAADPAALVPHAPATADHLILTYSHALDLDLCHRLLTHGFNSAGLIGSATKWARFRSRLAALGHAPQSTARIRCPIGDPALGKHPQAIAIGVATAYLNPTPAAARQEIAG
ncbi:MAG: XdhC family protein [Gemmobacter sp.]